MAGRICPDASKGWISGPIIHQNKNMTEAENQFLTRVGPGTPMGKLMRQYWIPVLQSTDLPEPDGPPLRVRAVWVGGVECARIP